MRLFLAVDLPTKIKENINLQLTPIKKEYPQFLWNNFENYHVTVHFIGETQNVEEIKKKTEDLLFDQESFYLYSVGCDLFMKNRITLYVNFRREKKIEKLSEKLRESFIKNSPSNLKFVPHMTIARAKIPSKQQYFVLKKRLEKLNIESAFEVKKITLFESLLGGRETVYKKIKNFPLIKE